LSTYCLACVYDEISIDLRKPEVEQHCYEHTEYAIKYLEQILSIDETSRPLISRKLGTYYQGYIFFNDRPNAKDEGIAKIEARFENKEKAIEFLDNAINSWNQKDNT